MRPIKTPHSNFLYRRGDAGVADMPCEFTQVTGGPLDGANIVYETWEPTPEERKKIANGANIRVGIIYTPVPPVKMDVVDHQEVTV